MPKLARLRFVSIGHPNARLPDITLDLRDEAHRATDSTLWLRNGGGKSSILNLFFAVIRPDRREFLGGKADSKRRRLEDYVLSSDHAVVACDWELDDERTILDLETPPRRLITGVFYEWRPGGGEETRLRRLFFSGIAGPPGSSVDLDALPLYIESSGGGSTSPNESPPRRQRRRTLSGFRQEWQALRDRHPHLQLTATENQREWQDILTSSGIDPELFSYQIRMNQREGAADELFRFDEHEQFSDFLLEVAFDPDLGERVSRNIATYRSELRERKDRWIPERDLVSGLVDRLSPLTELAATRRETLGAAARTRGELHRLRAHVDSRQSDVRVDLEQIEQDRRAELDEAREVEREAEELRAYAAVLRRRAATLRLERAETDLAAAQDAVERADRARKTWEAALPLRGARRAEARARDLRTELEKKQSEHAPLRTRLESAAGDLARALSSRSRALRSDESAARNAAESQRRAESEAREGATAASRRAARLETEIEQLETVLAEGRAARERCTDDGSMRSDESGSDAVERLAAELTDCEARQRDNAADDAANQSKQGGVRGEIETTSTQRGELAARLEAEERTHEEATERRRELEENPLLRRLLEVESIDLERGETDVAQTLTTAARRALEGVIRFRIEMVEDDRAVAHLEDQGLLPPTREVERLLGLLRRRIPAVWSGWGFLAENVPADRDAALRHVQSRPEIALGIVVRDADFEKTREILRELPSGDIPDVPVVVSAQGAPSARDAAGSIVVGPRSLGYYDRDEAQRELIVRRGRVQETRTRIAEGERARADIEELSGRCREFRRVYPVGWFAAKRESIDGTRAGLEGCDARLAENRRLLGELEATAKELRDAAAKIIVERRRVERSLLVVRDYVERYERPGAERERTLVAARRDAARRRARGEGATRDRRERRRRSRARARRGRPNRGRRAQPRGRAPPRSVRAGRGRGRHGRQHVDNRSGVRAGGHRIPATPARRPAFALRAAPRPVRAASRRRGPTRAQP